MSKSNRPAKSRKSAPPFGYAAVLVEVKRMIGDARRRALASVNRGLVRLYWEIGRVIVAQQEKAARGEAVVERFAADLRAAFPDMKGLMSANLWRMRQLYLSCREVDAWLRRTHVSRQDQPPARRSKGVVGRLSPAESEGPSKLATVWRESADPDADPILATLRRELSSEHGLILCKSANGVQMRLALTAAARKIGVATYQTALPEERLIVDRLKHLPDAQESGS